MKRFLLALYFITGLSHAQLVSWAAKFGDVLNDSCTDVALDAAGNVYAVGLFRNSVDFDPGPGVFYINEESTGVGDMYCVKLSPQGQLLWAKPVGGAEGYSVGEEITPTVTVDAAGNVIVAGIYAATTDMDPGQGTVYLPGVGGTSPGNFISKFTSSGTLLWSKNYGGSFGQQFNRRVRTDAAGNIYVAGYFRESITFDGSAPVTLTATGSNYNGYMARFDAQGDLAWAFQLGNPGVNCYIRDMATDPSGNLLVTGSFGGAADFDPRPDDTLTLESALGGQDIFIAKYDSSDSACLWAKQIGEASSFLFEQGDNIAADAAGNVLCSGSFRNTADFDPAPGDDHVFNMTAVGQVSEYFLKLTTEGDFTWAKTIGAISEDGVYNYSEKTFGMTADAEGSLYATGQFLVHMDADPGEGVFSLNANGGSYQVFNLKLDAQGNFAWATAMGPNTNLNARGRAIMVNPFGEVVIGGTFQGSMDVNPNGAPHTLSASGSSGYDGFLFSVAQEDLAVNAWTPAAATAYPNPFTDKVTAASSKPVLGCALYDMSGRLMMTSDSGELYTAGVRPGSYVVQIHTADSVDTQKLVKK